MILSMSHAVICVKFGEEETFRLFNQVGFTGVDYSFCDRGLDFENYIEMAKETKRLLDKYNLVCNQAHAPYNFSYGESMDESSKNFLDIVRCFEYAQIIGAKVVVVHAVKLPPEVDFYDYNYKYYKALEPYAKKCNVKIAIENLLNSKFWLPNKLCGFINSLESDVFCACVDVGHCAIVGVSPEKFIDGMEKDKILCVHLHDTDGQMDRHWTPFQGIHNWQNIIKALAKYNFKGDMSLEVIHSFDNLPLELYPAMLEYIAKVGKLLINEFEKSV